MAEANKRKVWSESSRETAATNLSLFPRDLLPRFAPLLAEVEDEEEAEAEIELNLGLSLGGRFGVDKGSSSGSKKLTRSSSIVGTMPIIRGEQSAKAEAEISASTAPPHRGLTRTTSLPTETEEEWRRRKEIQTLRRMEAKRRRSEKQRNINTKTEASNSEASGLPARWSTAANKGGFLRKHSKISRQGSVESHGGDGGSSSELDFKPLQAGSSNQEQTSKETTAPAATMPLSNALRRLSSVEMNLQVKEEKSEMPSVFTRGEGPNGKRVEGILYKYGKGEEVRIICVCHGSFLSPAEFVKHAGGDDVDNPLRHIVVNTVSSSSSFLS